MKGLVSILVAAVLCGMGFSANALTSAQLIQSNGGTPGDWHYWMSIDEMNDLKVYHAYTKGADDLGRDTLVMLRCTVGKELDVYFVGELPLVDRGSALVRFDKKKSEKVFAEISADGAGLFLADTNSDDKIALLSKMMGHKTLRIKVYTQEEGYEVYKYSLLGSKTAIKAVINGCYKPR